MEPSIEAQCNTVSKRSLMLEELTKLKVGSSISTTTASVAILT